MTPEIQSRIRTNGRAIFRGFAKGLTRRVKRSVVRWAREVRKMPKGGPLSGANIVRYTTEFCPHVVEIMDAMDDPSVRVIVEMMGVRDMKTSSGLNAVGRCVTDDPGGIYCVQPDEKSAERFEAGDLEPMINLNLEQYFVQKKSRDSGRTKTFKKFAGGAISIVIGGSPTDFRGTTVKMLLVSEVDGFRGDTKAAVYKAINRTTGIPDAIIILESTPTKSTLPPEKPGDNPVYRSSIAEWYDKSDKRKWFVECEDCRELSVIFFPGVCGDDRFSIGNQIRTSTGDPADAKWHCPRCDHGHEEGQWFHAAQSGLWLPTAGLSGEDILSIRDSHKDARAQQPEVRGYWRNGFNSLLPKSKGYRTKLHEFLSQGEAAKSSPDAHETWTNEIAAELWDESAIGEPAPEWEPLMARALPSCDDSRGFIVPADALILCGGGDVHPDRIEWTWLGFGRGETCWVINHVVTLGDTRDHSRHGPWHRLHQELQRTFTHERGGTIGLEMGLIDAGYGWDDVLTFLRTGVMQGKLRACRGSSTYPAPVVSGYGKIVTGRPGQGTLYGHFVGTDAVKDTLYSRLRLIPTPEGYPEGWIHFFDRLDQSYYEQLTAEKVEIVSVGGREERRYRKKAMQRNETTDTWVYGYAAFRRRSQWDWDAIERERMKLSEPEEPEEKPFVPPSASSRGGFGSGWNL